MRGKHSKRKLRKAIQSMQFSPLFLFGFLSVEKNLMKATPKLTHEPMSGPVIWMGRGGSEAEVFSATSARQRSPRVAHNSGVR